MLRTHLILLLLVVLAAAAPANGQDPVVARVNGDSITVDRFNATYVQRLIGNGRNDTPQERYAHLNDLIDSYLLAEAARERGLEDAEYQEYIDMEIRKIVGGRFFEIAFADSFPDPSRADILEAFRRTKEKAILRHLFFQHPDSAREAYLKLEAGADFVDLANRVFETASFDSSAGYLGVAEYWDLDDAVAEAVWPLAIGEYTEPIRSKFGWHIVRLEDRLRNPILTEEEFERRREDLTYRVRARRFRLEGDRFVRSFMDSLDVEVNVDAMNTLRLAVLDVVDPNENAQAPSVTLDEQEVAAVRDEFSPETALLTYSFDAERKTFTAAEYFDWMEHLPAGEIRNRTAASVGRALRNQVLAERGLSLGLHADRTVRDEVEYRASTYLAAALRERLRQESAHVEPTETELREAYERLGFRKLNTAEADFWHIKFDDLKQAEAAKTAIASGESSPDTYASYAERTDADLKTMGELGVHVQKAPLGQPVVIGTGDGGWHVVQVDDRTVEYTTFDQARGDLEQTFRPFVPEMRLLRALRSKADVDINVDLFEEMMKLGREQPAGS